MVEENEFPTIQKDFGFFMNLFRQQAGFTIMEMVTVIFIISLLSTIVIVDYGVANKKNNVILGAQNLISDVHRAQSYSLSGKNFGNSDIWGIHLQTASTSYTLFTDVDGDGFRKGDNSENFQVVDLPKGVKIKNIDSGSSSTVVFIPPSPITVISSSTISSSTITISDLDNNNERKIKINIFGLVEVVN
jgi:prepilin-type N-terminal cleavage/methylation domain-containing protein